jgi:uncharacterized protein (TIGR00730 family)
VLPGRPPSPRRRKSLLTEHLPALEDDAALTREQRYVREAMETLVKLLRDGTRLGDVKLLNAALRELRYAFKVFAPYRGVRKVSVFGSARTKPTEASYKAAAEFARMITAQNYMVITGAGSGIMAAAQEGAGAERSFGVNIRLPFEQGANEFILKDPKLTTFRYFFTRKLMFIKEADAAALFPGGFGTLDEGYECLTLVQTGKTKPMPIVFVDSPRGTYWKTWKRYVEDHLLRQKLISPDDMSLFKVTSSVEEAVEEITGFYRVYHSSRTVGRNLVIRLNTKLDERLVASINRDFRDILIGAEAVQTRALAEEEDEPELAALPRLVLPYDRTHFGRLRQLIDRVNQEA